MVKPNLIDFLGKGNPFWVYLYDSIGFKSKHCILFRGTQMFLIRNDFSVTAKRRKENKETVETSESRPSTNAFLMNTPKRSGSDCF